MISIIIPMYNVASNLDRCLNAIQAQTLRDWEVVLVDDGSADQTAKIAQNWCRRDERFRLIPQANQGVSAARNAGIRAAAGQMCCFIDADDYIEPTYLEDLCAHFHTNVLPVCNFVHNNNLAPVLSPTWTTYRIPVDGAWQSDYLIGTLGKHIAFSAWNKLFNMDFIRQYKLCFPVGITVGEDMIFILSYLAHCREIIFVNKGLYHYTISPNSAMNSEKDYLPHYEKTLRYLQTHFFGGKQIDESTLKSWAREVLLLILTNPVITRKNYVTFQEYYCRLRESLLFRYAAHASFGTTYKRVLLSLVLRIKSEFLLFVLIQLNSNQEESLTERLKNKISILLQHHKTLRQARLYRKYLAPGQYILGKAPNILINTQENQSSVASSFGQMSNGSANHSHVLLVVDKEGSSYQGRELLLTGKNIVKIFIPQRTRILSIFPNIKAYKQYYEQQIYAHAVFPSAKVFNANPKTLTIEEEMLRDEILDAEHKFQCLLKFLTHAYTMSKCPLVAKHSFPCVHKNKQIQAVFDNYFQPAPCILPTLLQHGDLWSANVFVSSDHQVGFIDFDHLSNYVFFYDIMLYLFTEGFVKNNHTLIKNFFAGKYDAAITKICTAVGISLAQIGRETLFVCAFEEMLNIRLGRHPSLAKQAIKYLQRIGVAL